MILAAEVAAARGDGPAALARYIDAVAAYPPCADELARAAAGALGAAVMSARDAGAAVAACAAAVRAFPRAAAVAAVAGAAFAAAGRPGEAHACVAHAAALDASSAAAAEGAASAATAAVPAWHFRCVFLEPQDSCVVFFTRELFCRLSCCVALVSEVCSRFWFCFWFNYNLSILS